MAAPAAAATGVTPPAALARVVGPAAGRVASDAGVDAPSSSGPPLSRTSSGRSSISGSACSCTSESSRTRGSWAAAEPGHHPVQPHPARPEPVGRRRRVGGDEVRRADDPPPRRVRAVGLAGQHASTSAAIPWQNGQGDVVRAYVDAFRSHGLLPGLYYSVWDSTTRWAASTSDSTPGVTADQLAYVKAQLTELLTNYGPIPLLIFDGWAWKMGHRQVPYHEIRALVKSLQPNCLMLDNSTSRARGRTIWRASRRRRGTRSSRPTTRSPPCRCRRSTPPAATTGSGRRTSAAS